MVIIGRRYPPLDQRQSAYTIIDGTHRAVAFLKMHLNGEHVFPWHAILIASPTMSGCQWSADSEAAQKLSSACEEVLD